MIFDDLEHASRYLALGPRFKAGFEWLARPDAAHLPDGDHEIGDGVRAIVQTYPTKPPEQGRWEAHRRHADIQLILRGVERMGVAPLARMHPQSDYDPKKDVEFFTGEAGQFLRVDAGAFAIFWPHDVHMPNLAATADGAPAVVTKVVIKVRLD